MKHQAISLTPKTIILLFLSVVVFPFLPLLIAQRWDWVEAWIYAIILIVTFVLSRVIAGRRHPDLLTERAQFMKHKDAKPWERILVPLMVLIGFLLPLSVGLEALVDPSPEFGLLVKTVSLTMILGGCVLSSWALIENRFFSAVVRIQTDRGHHVISTGPYRRIRHPGYLGILLVYWATPFFLDSWWAFLPVALLTIVLVIRTRLEDWTLREELEGYRDYAGQVRYRLLPGVW